MLFPNLAKETTYTSLDLKNRLKYQGLSIFGKILRNTFYTSYLRIARPRKLIIPISLKHNPVVVFCNHIDPKVIQINDGPRLKYLRGSISSFRSFPSSVHSSLHHPLIIFQASALKHLNHPSSSPALPRPSTYSPP